jgi:hypothetical protein
MELSIAERSEGTRLEPEACENDASARFLSVFSEYISKPKRISKIGDSILASLLNLQGRLYMKLHHHI